MGGEGFAVDSSLVAADVCKHNRDAEAAKPKPDPSRAVAEYLAVLDDAAFGAATPVQPKYISAVDPAARWTAASRGPAVFAYADNYLIDLKCAVIMDVEPTTAVRQAEVTAAKTMITRTAERLGVEPARLAADTGYGLAEILAWLVEERGIEPHIPVFDKSGRTDGSLSRADFTYDHAGDVYICPANKLLTTRGTLVNDDATLMYRASTFDCGDCALKPRCCPTTPARKVPRSIYEGARDLAREIAETDAFVVSRRERKKIEMLFAHLKRILGLGRLRLRGPCGAKDEFLLAATAQNLRKLAKLLSLPQPITG